MSEAGRGGRPHKRKLFWKSLLKKTKTQLDHQTIWHHPQPPTTESAPETTYAPKSPHKTDAKSYANQTAPTP